MHDVLFEVILAKSIAVCVIVSIKESIFMVLKIMFGLISAQSNQFYRAGITAAVGHQACFLIAPRLWGYRNVYNLNP